MDDSLKSADDLSAAKILVKNVVDMCKSGGFHLTKFISNNRELLMNIFDNQTRYVKNADLIDIWILFNRISLKNLSLSNLSLSTFR